MTKPAAIAGVYADLKTVKTRSVCQVIIEIPIEHGKDIVDAFGFPQPGNEVNVAIARIHAEVEAKPSNPETPTSGVSASAPRKFHEMPLPSQIALRCQTLAFQNYIQVEGEEEAAEWVRNYLKVSSRAEVQPGTEAAERWCALDIRYQDWLNDPDAQKWEDDWEAGA